MSDYTCTTCGKHDSEIVNNVEIRMCPCNCGKAFFCNEICFNDAKLGHAGRIDSDHTVGLNVKRLVGHGHYDEILLEVVHDLDHYMSARFGGQDDSLYVKSLKYDIPERMSQEVSKKERPSVLSSMRQFLSALIDMVEKTGDERPLYFTSENLIKIWSSENRFTGSRKKIDESWKAFVGKLVTMVTSRESTKTPDYMAALAAATSQARETGRVLNGKSK